MGMRNTIMRKGGWFEEMLCYPRLCQPPRSPWAGSLSGQPSVGEAVRKTLLGIHSPEEAPSFHTCFCFMTYASIHFDAF